IRNDRVVATPTKTIKGGKQVRRGGKGFWRGGGIAPGFRHDEVLPTITDKAVAFIERHAVNHGDKPFFLYLPLSAPHTPWLPLKRFRGQSKAGAYGDFVTQVDDTVGRVLAALDKRKLTGKTLVILTSDNGAHWTPADKKKFGHLANRHLRGQKADAWEGGHRIPFLARWPGVVKPGSLSNETLCLTDLLATAAAIVGETLPDNAGEDSFSFLPVLKGAALKKPIREAVVHHSLAGVFAIRKGPWKLILGRGSGGFSKPRRIVPKSGEAKGQLYNLANDPSEKQNLYLEKPGIVKNLAALLRRYKKDGRSRPLN
ncbi:MAG: sulfatase-like hydrolase/transferase, partial [Planctomycetaceae bacterium]